MVGLDLINPKNTVAWRILTRCVCSVRPDSIKNASKRPGSKMFASASSA